VTHFDGCAPLVVIAVIRLSNSSFFSFNFFTKLSIALFANVSLSPPCLKKVKKSEQINQFMHFHQLPCHSVLALAAVISNMKHKAILTIIPLILLKPAMSVPQPVCRIWPSLQFCIAQSKLFIIDNVQCNDNISLCFDHYNIFDAMVFSPQLSRTAYWQISTCLLASRCKNYFLFSYFCMCSSALNYF